MVQTNETDFNKCNDLIEGCWLWDSHIVSFCTNSKVCCWAWAEMTDTS